MYVCMYVWMDGWMYGWMQIAYICAGQGQGSVGVSN
jgi:hypothetical protein